jgi:hypothetical protein
MPNRVEVYDLMTFDEKTKVGKAFWFVCPGCGQGHRYVTRTDGGSPSWEFSGTPESPTFSPSLIYRWGDNGNRQICHFFVKDGRIEFQSDCTHSMKGRTVELPEIS